MAVVNKKKKESNIDKYIGTGVGLGALGGMSIDRRIKHDYSKIKHLGWTSQEVQKHLKPGDVLVGGFKTYPEQMRGEYKDFKQSYKSLREKGSSRVKSLKGAVKQIDYAGVVSKIGDPSYSHATMVIDNKNTMYGGGSYSPLANNDLPKTKADLKFWKEKGLTPHYTVVRPKAGVSEVPAMMKSDVKKGVNTNFNKLYDKAGVKKNYTMLGGVLSQVQDWVTPKFRKKERVKSVASVAADAKCIGGVCSTLPAHYTKETIGGKATKKVLPKDFLRSPNWSVVGTAGRTTPQKSLLTRTLMATPKWAVRTGVAGTVGLGAYGLSKYIRSRNQRVKTAEIKQEAFNDELQKLGLLSHGVASVAKPGKNYFLKSTNALRSKMPLGGKTAPKLKSSYKIPKIPSVF